MRHAPKLEWLCFRAVAGGWQLFVLALSLTPVLSAFADTHYVSPSGGHNPPFTNWTDAATDIQSAIDVAVDGDETWVAAGTYIPGANRTDTFQLKNGVDLYGGFRGTETNRNQRNWKENVTILSGDINGDDVSFQNNSENVHHVVKGCDNTTFDGFTIKGGNANGAWPDSDGGGMYNPPYSPTVRNCTFFGNFASGYGGGMCNTYSSLTVQNCTFFGNSAGASGGGMATGPYSPTVQDCTFSGNSADWGGGMFNTGSARVRNCTFFGNSGREGGGMFNWYYSCLPTVENCMFAGNSAVQGGGMNNALSSPTVQNCTFAGNSAVQGGGMFNSGSSPTVRNCILWGNSPELHNRDGSEVSINYCDIEGGWNGPGVYNDGTSSNLNGGGNMDVAPLFADGTSRVWTAHATYEPDTFQSTLTDAHASWTPGQLAGKFVNPDTNQILQYVVVSNDANTVTVWGNLSINALNGKPYQVHDYHLKSRAGRWETGLRMWTNDNVNSPCIDFGDPASVYTNEPEPNGLRVNVGVHGNTAQASKSPALRIDNNGGATKITGTAARLNGGLVSTDAVPTLVWIYWGESNEGTTKGNWDHEDAMGAVPESTFFEDINGLASNTLYYYRCYASNAYGEAWAPAAQSFITGEITVEATDPNVTEEGGNPGEFTVYRPVGVTNLDLRVNYTASGAATAGSDYETLTGSVVIPAGQVSAAIPVIPIDDVFYESNDTVVVALMPGLYAIGSPSNAIVTITEDDEAPVVSNDGGASNITATSAQFNGNLISTGAAPTEVYFYWGPSDGGTNPAGWANVTYMGQLGTGAFSTNITGLASNSTYYYRCYTTNAAGAGWALSSVILMTERTIFVQRAASGANDGTSWVDAYTNLHDALLAAVNASEIWVAAGTYIPGTNRTDTFRLREGVSLYGGFDGTEARRDQRDWSNNVTTLSGDVLDDDFWFIGNVENVYHVVTVTNNATVDGFTVIGGNADGGGWNSYGGGVYCDGGGTAENCSIIDCYAYYDGGGVYCEGGGTVENCSIIDCYAYYNGGGVSCYHGGLVSNCTISGNSAYNWGGGVYCDGGGTVQNCSIIDNRSEWDYGGGVYSYYGTIQNCTISGNSSGEWYDGGGVVCDEGSTVENCLITGNVGDYDGGGICSWGGDVRIRNCTIVGNSGGGVYASWGTTVENCIIWSNAASSGANWAGSASCFAYTCTTPDLGGTGNITNDPQLVATYRVRSTSPCIDAGTSSNAPLTDMDGDARWDHPDHSNIVSIVDMGADEYVPGPGAQAIINAPSPWYAHIEITVDGSNSYDLDGTIVSWDWELNGDGLYDDTNGAIVTWTFDTGGVVNVGLRVVDNDGNTNEITRAITMIESLNVPTDYPTIQAAIDAATNGDVIFVASGTYTENVTIAKSVILVGQDRDATTIENGTSNHTLVVTGDNVQISELTLRNSSASNAALYLDRCSGTIIEDISISDGYYGIYADQSTNAIIRNNLISACTYGIYNARTTGSAVQWNTMRDGQWGMVTYQASNELVRYNNFINNSVYGAKDYSSSLVLCFNWNYFSGNGIGYGYDPPETNLPVLEFNGNILEDNGIGVEVAGASTVEVSGNTIANNDTGILVTAASPVIAQNTIRGNDVGIVLQNNSDPTIISNSVYASGELDVRNDDPSVEADVSHNWWGGTAPRLSGNVICPDPLAAPCIPIPPIAEAGLDQRVEAGQEVQFDGSASYDPDGSIVSYGWDFGDGNGSSEVSPRYVYQSTGTYVVVLTVQDNEGVTDKTAITVATVWGVQYQLDTDAGAHGSVSLDEGWYAPGAEVQIVAAPGDYRHFAGWTGSGTNLITVGDVNAVTVTVTMSTGVQLTARFEDDLAPRGTPEWWLARYDLTEGTFAQEELKDTDGDGMFAWQEYIAGTDPTNRGDVFCVRDLNTAGIGQNVAIHWASVPGKTYGIEYSTNLGVGFDVVASNVLGTSTTGIHVHSNATENLATFYRMIVE